MYSFPGHITPPYSNDCEAVIWPGIYYMAESLIQGNFSGEVSIGSNLKFYISQIEIKQKFGRSSSTVLTFPFAPTYAAFIWEWVTTANGNYVDPSTDISTNWQRYRGSVDILTPGKMSMSFKESHGGNTVTASISGTNFTWSGSDSASNYLWGRAAYIILAPK